MSPNDKTIVLVFGDRDLPDTPPFRWRAGSYQDFEALVMRHIDDPGTDDEYIDYYGILTELDALFARVSNVKDRNGKYFYGETESGRLDARMFLILDPNGRFTRLNESKMNRILAMLDSTSSSICFFTYTGHGEGVTLCTWYYRHKNGMSTADIMSGAPKDTVPNDMGEVVPLESPDKYHQSCLRAKILLEGLKKLAYDTAKATQSGQTEETTQMQGVEVVTLATHLKQVLGGDWLEEAEAVNPAGIRGCLA